MPRQPSGMGATTTKEAMGNGEGQQWHLGCGVGELLRGGGGAAPMKAHSHRKLGKEVGATLRCGFGLHHIFALEFLCTELLNLNLAVLHVDSSALWRTAMSRRVRWDASVSLSFNGCLVLSDDKTEVLWSIAPIDSGDKMVLLNSSNIQIQKLTTPVDVLPFNTFNRRITGLCRLTLESDGNLHAYYWNDSIWNEDLRAIADHCEISTSCDTYGLCNSVDGSCGCLREVAGDFYAARSNVFDVLRRQGVDLANDKLTPHLKVASLEQCEESCERNCSCWGAIHHNMSGYYYRLDYPITLVATNERKVGYFKVWMSGNGGRTVKKAMLAVGGVLFAGAVAVAGYGVWKRWRGRRLVVYMDLNSASSQLIELSSTFNNGEQESQFD
ncbi:hypothetical protein ZIOFF_012832 [Zingiber officinale]|uniref:S-locus glycoprotein domain-containing protein n=1 Tax=Zingiber officinale TaxID=94328 RepID=A0A8J5HRD5_ZINOF|nr:hypothetical protein ZIOFF_012832 [Zingiber officinale]